MTIQFDANITGETRMTWKGNRKGFASSSQGSSSSSRTWAFPVEEEVWTEDYDGGGEESHREQEVWVAGADEEKSGRRPGRDGACDGSEGRRGNDAGGVGLFCSRNSEVDEVSY